MTRLASFRADIAFTTHWYWENHVQYDNVTYGLGLNSILRWIPRAGREMVLVVNRELIDCTRDRTFTSVTGDVTFKFSHTFRFRGARRPLTGTLSRRCPNISKHSHCLLKAAR